MNTIANGWAVESGAGVYHFEHIPSSAAEDLMKKCENMYVIETVNWTLADKKSVHLNKYFAPGLISAIGMAAQLVSSLQEVAEDIVAIREATPQEEALFFAALDHFESQLPSALSDSDVSQMLPKSTSQGH
jgi:hypothetical protein